MILNLPLFHQTYKAFGSVAKSPSLFVAAKEEEKQKLMKWSSELKLEREQLELRVKQLSNSITVRWQTMHDFGLNRLGFVAVVGKLLLVGPQCIKKLTKGPRS